MDSMWSMQNRVRISPDFWREQLEKWSCHLLSREEPDLRDDQEFHFGLILDM
jgi:hypothetical protein